MNSRLAKFEACSLYSNLFARAQALLFLQQTEHTKQ